MEEKLAEITPGIPDILGINAAHQEIDNRKKIKTEITKMLFQKNNPIENDFRNKLTDLFDQDLKRHIKNAVDELRTYIILDSTTSNYETTIHPGILNNKSRQDQETYAQDIVDMLNNKYNIKKPELLDFVRVYNEQCRSDIKVRINTMILLQDPVTNDNIFQTRRDNLEQNNFIDLTNHLHKYGIKEITFDNEAKTIRLDF